MTPSHPHDPFVDLWHTAPKPDTQQVLRDLQRHRRMHRRFNWGLALILAMISLLLISKEVSGRLPTLGWLSAIWLLSLAASAVWHWRVHGRRTGVLERDTVSLLKFMIRQARTDLFLAQCLYKGVPLGAAFGFLVMKFLGLRPAPRALTADPLLVLIQTSVAVAVLIAMVVTGVILARSRRTQVQELSEKLKLIDTGL